MTIIDPGLGDLSIALLLFALVVLLSVKEGLSVEKNLTIATVRMVAQLFLMGQIVSWLFGVTNAWLIVLALLLMSAYAARAGLSRMKQPVPGLYMPMWAGVAIGTFFTTFVVTALVLKADPWYRADILIPLCGMILGNAMNGGALAADRLHSELSARKEEIETWLSLGLDYRAASESAVKEAVRSALLPTINTMMTIGLVHLPGMMVGQVLGGVDPTTAVKYQMIVMLMVASAVTLAAVVFVKIGLGKFFNQYQQLRHDLL
jgi:putative ABC transport system permease protein